MASEYLKWKYRDVKPREAARELTGREKRANWWHYHKWHVAVAVVLVLTLGDILWHVLGFAEVEPDYQVAYVGRTPLPDDAAAALQQALAALGVDCSGDGETVVQLNQYISGGEAAADYTYASYARLMGDLESCESYFFLLEDPEEFQRNYQVLRPLTGEDLPENAPYEDCVLAWSDCPVLTALDLGTYTHTVLGEEVTGETQDLCGGLYLARRGFWTEKTAPYSEECGALWDILTEGAMP